MDKQTTLNQELAFEGKGLHTGVYVHITLRPAKADTGYVFRRVDLEGKPEIKADARAVSYTQRGTVLTGPAGEKISTIEHVLSALRGLGVDNCEIDIDGPEVPILDGSALLYTTAIRKVGLRTLDAERKYLVVTHKVVYEDKAKGISIIAMPDDHFAAHVCIAFDGSRCLGNQWAAIESLGEQYQEVEACRTFVFLHEIQPLLQMGLIKGGDLDNAIVFVENELTDEQKDALRKQLGREQITIHPSGVLNAKDLQYANEPARHKLLDLIGDLSLALLPIKGRIIATRSGHGSNTVFAQMLIKEFLA
ncbi:MAG: UDP-3-O-acyl-N-acetylglucosamine deacetylase [Bacteroidales bacterium]|nr:UDP-3-O-acyl-N-acetylglucosamine deacetylase [Bacteroidales bacterium]